MKRAAGSGVLPLLLLAAVHCAGERAQPGPGAPAQAGSRPQTVRTGTTIDLDPACRLGLGDSAPAAAKVAWWPTGARDKVHLDVSALVPVNGLIPACGKLYRLLRTGRGGGHRPGSDRAPVGGLDGPRGRDHPNLSATPC